MYANGKGRAGVRSGSEEQLASELASEQVVCESPVHLFRVIVRVNGEVLPEDDVARRYACIGFAAEFKGMSDGTVRPRYYGTPMCEGVPEDAAEAVRWYGSSAEQGYASLPQYNGCVGFPRTFFRAKAYRKMYVLSAMSGAVSRQHKKATLRRN